MGVKGGWEAIGGHDTLLSSKFDFLDTRRAVFALPHPRWGPLAAGVEGSGRLSTRWAEERCSARVVFELDFTVDNQW